MSRSKTHIGCSDVALVALTACFVMLKATGYVDWSWWWVFAPLWAPLGLWLLLILVGYAAAAIVALYEAR